MAKFSGELPFELVNEIRELSKPVFTYFREYNKVLLALNMTEWSELREKLCSKDGEKVCIALNLFLKAHNTLEQAEQYYDAYRVSIGEDPRAIQMWDFKTQSFRGPVLTQEQQEKKRLWSQLIGRALAQEGITKRALMVEVYGEDLVSWQEMMNRRESRFGTDDFGY